MSPQYINLTRLEPDQLDAALSLGWFRIQQSLFTTDELEFGGLIYEAIWLRVHLPAFEPDKKYTTLTRKNAGFHTEISKAVITSEQEALYAAYKNHLPFEASSSLHTLLLGEDRQNVFNTRMINMYAGDRLIGTGYFDLGRQAASGIVSFYDPAYKNYSLGLFMIYEKMFYCKREGFAWFYPGYFVPGYPMFDYKKKLGKGALAFYDRQQNTWYPLPASDPEG